MSALNLKMHNQKPKASVKLKVVVLGQSYVGKSAMVVRFITRRFIGEYDTRERIYNFNTIIDNETVNFEILDSCGINNQESEFLINQLEANIRWADAFILVYSVTDKCSFEEVNRLKFLINYNKRRRKIHKDDFIDVPVILVANKIDQANDRMVSREEGQKRCEDIGCACFHEISTRESIEDVQGVFRDVCRFWRFFSKFPKLKRSKSDNIRLSMTIHSDVEMVLSPDKILSICCDDRQRSILLFGRSRHRWNEDEEEQDEFDELEPSATFNDEPFRSRAQTDGNLNLMRKTRKWKIGSPLVSPPQSLSMYRMVNRRNSMSMRGHVSY
ncbi:hypothetical protein PVAND_013301 [Polypedilum vanderplanki]|uniref:small monomeric GTPase n=1 Tax=Polypedilum vanderplanki TaxID=319348 RepID=A0A9J6CP32_POLVA|nr:hypothetical protein PVAND_013301 [Polypedilum vanderplanki]